MRRTEIVGKEGGTPPIMLVFHDENGEVIGFYVSVNATERPYTSGPMFA